MCIFVSVVWEQIPSDLASLWGELWEGLFVQPLPGGFSNIPVAFQAGFVSWYEPRGYGWFWLSPHSMPAQFLPETRAGKAKTEKENNIDNVYKILYCRGSSCCVLHPKCAFWGAASGKCSHSVVSMKGEATKCLILTVAKEGFWLKKKSKSTFNYGNKVSYGDLEQIKQVTPGIMENFTSSTPLL